MQLMIGSGLVPRETTRTVLMAVVWMRYAEEQR